MSNIIYLNRYAKALTENESWQGLSSFAQTPKPDVDGLFLAIGTILSIGLPLLTCFVYTDKIAFVAVAGAELLGAGIGAFNYYLSSFDNTLYVTGPPAAAEEAVERDGFKRAA